MCERAFRLILRVYIYTCTLTTSRTVGGCGGAGGGVRTELCSRPTFITLTLARAIARRNLSVNYPPPGGLDVRVSSIRLSARHVFYTFAVRGNRTEKSSELAHTPAPRFSGSLPIK